MTVTFCRSLNVTKPNTYPKDPVELCDYGHSDPKNLLVEPEFGLPLKIGCGSGNGVIDEPLTVHVTEEKNTVTWDLTGNDLTEAAELTFTFDKNRYYIAIQKLKEKWRRLGYSVDLSFHSIN